jgi:hypothetical protein
MVSSPEHADANHALVPLPSDRPARFESWPEDVQARCRELWSTVGNRNASRVKWLYSREVPENVAIPSASTIRRWAHDEAWASWANGELERTRGKTFYQLQTTWLHSLQLSQEVQIDAMLGRFDDNPAAGAVRIKAAESVQRVIAQAGLLAPLPVKPPVELADAERQGMSREEQEARALAALVRRQPGFDPRRG